MQPLPFLPLKTPGGQPRSLQPAKESSRPAPIPHEKHGTVGMGDKKIPERANPGIVESPALLEVSLEQHAALAHFPGKAPLPSHLEKGLDCIGGHRMGPPSLSQELEGSPMARRGFPKGLGGIAKLPGLKGSILHQEHRVFVRPEGASGGRKKPAPADQGCSSPAVHRCVLTAAAPNPAKLIALGLLEGQASLPASHLGSPLPSSLRIEGRSFVFEGSGFQGDLFQSFLKRKNLPLDPLALRFQDGRFREEPAQGRVVFRGCLIAFGLRLQSPDLRPLGFGNQIRGRIPGPSEVFRRNERNRWPR